MEFLYLAEPDMIAAGVMDMERCIGVMEETLILLADGDYRMAGKNSSSHGAMISFPKHPECANMPADGPDRRFMAMPAYLGGRFRHAGVKWYGSNAENRQQGLPRSIHMLVLNDVDTGAPKAIMSGNLLSAYRTGAVPGVGVKILAREDAEVVAVIGPGVMGRTLLEACMVMRPGIKKVKVKGRSESGKQSFIAWAKEKFPQLQSIIAVETMEEATRQADIVIAATTTDASGSAGFPYFSSVDIKPGALVLLPAAARFDDDYLLSGVPRLVVDYQGLYDAWAEEYGEQAYEQLGVPGTYWHSLLEQGKLFPQAITQMGDICAGRKPGRESEDEVILYSVGGMPVEDVAWATDIYEEAVDKGIGTKLFLWDTPEMW